MPALVSHPTVSGIYPAPIIQQKKKLLVPDRILPRIINLLYFPIVAVHGGMVKTDSFDTIRSYTLKKMKKHKNCFAFYRVDPPYKPITTHGVGKKLGNVLVSRIF